MPPTTAYRSQASIRGTCPKRRVVDGILRRTMSEEESTTPDLMELQKRLTDAANRRDLDAMMAF